VDRCQAIRYSDEMHCSRCRLRWDVNDTERPECSPKTESGVPLVKTRPLPPERLPYASGLPLDR
jgi:hypothetical protein